MAELPGIRSAEPWTVGSVIAGVVLAVLLVLAVIWLVRRAAGD